MKIALCLQGLSSGRNDKGNEVSFMKSYEYLKQNILDKDDVDVFIHTWNDNDDEIEAIKSAYNPISSIFEKQIKFGNEVTKIHSIKSRWYSHMKSVELKRQHEIINNIIYDFVLVSRFDNCFLTPFRFCEYDKNCIYSSNWHHPHNINGFLDYWFLSDSSTMDKFSNLYDMTESYLEDIGIQSNHFLSKHHANELDLTQKYIKHEYTDFRLDRCG
tara:strand:+ start:275 stop:919 length:645 start_codon:yes stop_codon:yes gene_type:complete